MYKENKRREPTKTPLRSNRGCRIPLAQRQTSTQGSSLASEPELKPGLVFLRVPSRRSSFARPQWLVFALASSRVPRANPAMPRYENPDDVEKDNRASEVVRRISRKNCARDGGWFSSPGVVINACIVFPNCPTHALLHQHVRLVPSFSLRAASS